MKVNYPPMYHSGICVSRVIGNFLIGDGLAWWFFNKE